MRGNGIFQFNEQFMFTLSSISSERQTEYLNLTRDIDVNVKEYNMFSCHKEYQGGPPPGCVCVSANPPECDERV